MRVSIVTTMFYSAPFVAEFYRRITNCTILKDREYEIIFVNDGSPDDSLGEALKLWHSDRRLRVVDLSRNFGHHQAVMAGLGQSTGNFVFLIDIDLEESPEWLDLFWQEMHATDADVVFGVQETRGGRLFKRLSGSLFYRLFNLLSDTQVTENQMTVRLMRREYVNALLQVRDRNLFLAGTMTWTGYKQRAVPLAKKHRTSGSTYTLARRISVFVNAITAFSSYPLRLFFFLGVIISAFAGLSGMYMLVDKLIHPEAVLLGYASLIVSIWFLGGLTILILGVIGIYLSRIFAEVKDRPPYIIRRVYQQNGDDLEQTT